MVWTSSSLQTNSLLAGNRKILPVVEVTSGADSGAGSLREAMISSDGPRFIKISVPRVTLNNRIVSDDMRNVVIQGAPTTIVGGTIHLRDCEDVTLENCRIYNPWGYSEDPLGVWGGQRITVQRCCFAFGTDQTGFFLRSFRGGHRPTVMFRRNIVAFPLVAGYPLIIDSCREMSLVENLFAHANTRPNLVNGKYMFGGNVFFDYNENFSPINNTPSSNSYANIYKSTVDCSRNLQQAAPTNPITKPLVQSFWNGISGGEVHLDSNAARSEAGSPIPEPLESGFTYSVSPVTGVDIQGDWVNVTAANVGTTSHDYIESTAFSNYTTRTHSHEPWNNPAHTLPQTRWDSESDAIHPWASPPQVDFYPFQNPNFGHPGEVRLMVKRLRNNDGSPFSGTVDARHYELSGSLSWSASGLVLGQSLFGVGFGSIGTTSGSSLSEGGYIGFPASASTYSRVELDIKDGANEYKIKSIINWSSITEG